MAKQTGLGDNLYVAGYDVSGDIGSLGRIGGGPATLDVTGINKSGYERIGGVRDGSIEFTSYFNPAVNQAHDVFSALPTSDDIVTYFRGNAIGNASASVVAKQIGYNGTRGNDGSLTFEISAQANGYGVEWGEQLTAGIRTDTTATNGSSLDGGAATSYGLQAYLQVFAFTGTSVTIKLQESADNAAWSDVTSGGFATVSAVGVERIATVNNQTVKRYLRVATSGTFSNVQFAVMVVRNQSTVVF